LVPPQVSLVDFDHSEGKFIKKIEFANFFSIYFNG